MYSTSAYHPPGDDILVWFWNFITRGDILLWGVIYTAPPVIKWVVVKELRLFTTPGGIL